jgi:hypothetical protein
MAKADQCRSELAECEFTAAVTHLKGGCDGRPHPIRGRNNARVVGREDHRLDGGEADMVLRWVAGAYLITEKNFRKIMGHENLWKLAAVLGRSKKAVTLEEKFA